MGGEVDLELSTSNETTPKVVSTGPTPGGSAPRTPKLKTPAPISIPSPYIVSAPASQAQTPRTRGARTPGWSRNITPRFLTPLGSPIRKALNFVKLDPQDAWLPITESRNGNAYYAAFHTLCSGIGFQALVLPVAFTFLGWTWGIILLTLAFTWQLYTLYLMVQLHEDFDKEIRYSRYMQLANAAFGEKLSKVLALFPIGYLSMGTCMALIIIGGSSTKRFYEIVCNPMTCSSSQLTSTEWYLVFTSAAVLLSQLPNLNSIAGISLIGAITAVGYCTMIWISSVAEGRIPGVSYNPELSGSEMQKIFNILNAIGIIAFAFRGHNLVLEIQATMPSSEKHPSRVPMWKGVKVSYTIILMCLFPLAIGGYWTYGQLIPGNGGILTALFVFHGQDTAKGLLGLINFIVVINGISTFQIYAMPMFDDLESTYTTRSKKPCPWWLRVILRALFGYFCFFVAVAMPFLGSFSGLIGGISLPVTLAYPCFMWLIIKKPKIYTPVWWLNWVLGVLGMCLSVLLIAAGIYVVIHTGVEASFFKPQ
ncbi:lysine histidine transporter-like 8 [Heracleum sosnowskyi]|uniref:Lysine histidine transporter-like 8 n=1 Tax=Heracleum sosnowskyi TaxID=360622 RepID=A0AAD8H6L4_9APIA|nr:lysine histidine transporter-like 8 [Heracleum sosnowskyi]